jgi:hypothetical protein
MEAPSPGLGRRWSPYETIRAGVLRWSHGPTTGRPAAPRVTCRSDERRSRSCAGRPTAACSIRWTARRPAACGGGRSTSDCCGTDAKRSCSPAAWSESVVGCRAAVDGVHRDTDGAQLVPSSQREHRGRLLGTPRARRSGERARALLHECRAGALSSATCGAPRTCPIWGGFSNAPPGPGKTMRAFLLVLADQRLSSRSRVSCASRIASAYTGSDSRRIASSGATSSTTAVIHQMLPNGSRILLPW